MRRLNGRDFGDRLRQPAAPQNELLDSLGGQLAPPEKTPAESETLDRRPAPSGGGSFFLNPNTDTRKILLARPEHLNFLSHLQKKFSNCLGYLPTAALQWYQDAGRIGIAFENDEPAGYVLGRTHYRYQPLMRPITQAAVAMDAQRRHHGLALVERVCAQAIANRQFAVQACCAADLEANSFWLEAGFEIIDTLNPENARGRQIIVWRKCLTRNVPDWFKTPPAVAGHRGRRVVR